MKPFLPPPAQVAQQGIEFQTALCPAAHNSDESTRAQLLGILTELQLQDHVQLNVSQHQGHSVFTLCLTDTAFATWTPEFDTLSIQARLAASNPGLRPDVRREIAIAMLASPQVFVLPSVAEWQAALDVRAHIALAAQKTALAFKTEAAERPSSHWRYDEDHGFILQPGADLQQALLLATQPEVSGRLYDFSCYRATEYVMLLGLSQALQQHNPALYRSLQQQCETHAIRSAKFHDVFCIEYGSMEQPLPARYYVPGDRLWFRNPDETSADVTGYEGSWVIYMGGGHFSNFWQLNKPFTLDAKCLEIFHWRHGCYRDPQGELQLNEVEVEARVQETLRSPQATQEIIARMMRPRDPRGVYAEGGCIDVTREYPRWFSTLGGNMVLPLQQTDH